MKTLIIVSIPGSVLGLDASDFPTGVPIEGRKYEFDGKVYQVTEITETLGSRSLEGTKITGYTRLLAFADAVSHGDEALKQGIVKPKQVGKDGPEDLVSAGGIIIGQTEDKPKLDTTGSEPVHIMFVKAVPAESKGGVRLPPIRLQSLAVDGAQSLIADAGQTDET